MCKVCGCEKGKVTVEYYRGNCVCCVEPRKALYNLMKNKYKDKVEIVEKNFIENQEFAEEALVKGIRDCSTFVIDNEKITDIARLEEKLKQIFSR